VNVGDDVVLRYITRDGRPGMSWAARLVEDDDLVALFMPAGTPHKRWTQTARGRELADAAWRRMTLRLMYPDRWYSIWLTWDDEAFQGYYVNFEEPFRRTPIGFDTNDHQLDIVVSPDRRWSWKDEDVVAERMRDGSFSHELVDAMHDQGREVVRAIELGSPPFDGARAAWRPSAGWTVPRLHPRWNTEPPAQWDRRLWAYPQARDRRLSESG
jgi:predicted RNA-binding protein associated with RNAse of E/G family